jgi:hypothetical protein
MESLCFGCPGNLTIEKGMKIVKIVEIAKRVRRVKTYCYRKQ